MGEQTPSDKPSKEHELIPLEPQEPEAAREPVRLVPAETRERVDALREAADQIGESGESNAFSAARFPGPKVMMIAGVAALVAALVLTFMNSPGQTGWRVILTAYNAFMHTGTGVVAVVLTAIGLGRAIGRLDFAAARMFLAVAVFLAVFHLKLNIPMGERLIVVLLAALAYAGVVWGTFRVSRNDAMVLCGMHLLLVFVVTLGSSLAVMVRQVASETRAVQVEPALPSEPVPALGR